MVSPSSLMLGWLNYGLICSKIPLRPAGPPARQPGSLLASPEGLKHTDGKHLEHTSWTNISHKKLSLVSCSEGDLTYFY